MRLAFLIQDFVNPAYEEEIHCIIKTKASLIL